MTAALMKGEPIPTAPAAWNDCTRGSVTVWQWRQSGLLDHGADVNAKETLRGTAALMWAANEGHAAAVQLLLRRGAEFTVRASPAPRARGTFRPSKAADPRKAIAALAAAIAAAEASPDLNVLNSLGQPAASRPCVAVAVRLRQQMTIRATMSRFADKRRWR